MARGLNKVMLLGNLGKDPEMKYTTSGKAITKFSLATTDSWKDDSGNQVERTEWHNIIIWGKLGEIAHQYLKKGSKAYLEGRINTRSYEDKDGNKKYITEIVATDMVMLDRKESSVDNGEYVQPPAQSDGGKQEDDLPF